jgi:hypothetical protein
LEDEIEHLRGESVGSLCLLNGERSRLRLGVGCVYRDPALFFGDLGLLVGALCLLLGFCLSVESDDRSGGGEDDE